MPAGLPRPRVGGIYPADPPLAAGRGPLVLLVQRPGQDDVGVVAGLRQEEVDGRIELEAVERLGREVGVGGRDGGIEGDRDEPLYVAGMDLLDDHMRRDNVA